eukprot:COSAG01_NODE_2998_length_6738_cov_333.158458_4_plen_218_part_00
MGRRGLTSSSSSSHVTTLCWQSHLQLQQLHGHLVCGGGGQLEQGLDSPTCARTPRCSDSRTRARSRQALAARRTGRTAIASGRGKEQVGQSRAHLLPHCPPKATLLIVIYVRCCVPHRSGRCSRLHQTDPVDPGWVRCAPYRSGRHRSMRPTDPGRLGACGTDAGGFSCAPPRSRLASLLRPTDTVGRCVRPTDAVVQPAVPHRSSTFLRATPQIRI